MKQHHLIQPFEKVRHNLIGPALDRKSLTLAQKVGLYLLRENAPKTVNYSSPYSKTKPLSREILQHPDIIAEFNERRAEQSFLPDFYELVNQGVAYHIEVPAPFGLGEIGDLYSGNKWLLLVQAWYEQGRQPNVELAFRRDDDRLILAYITKQLQVHSKTDVQEIKMSGAEMIYSFDNSVPIETVRFSLVGGKNDGTTRRHLGEILLGKPL